MPAQAKSTVKTVKSNKVARSEGETITLSEPSSISLESKTMSSEPPSASNKICSAKNDKNKDLSTPARQIKGNKFSSEPQRTVRKQKEKPIDDDLVKMLSGMIADPSDLSLTLEAFLQKCIDRKMAVYDSHVQSLKGHL